MVWAPVSGSKPHPPHSPTLFLSAQEALPRARRTVSAGELTPPQKWFLLLYSFHNLLWFSVQLPQAW